MTDALNGGGAPHMLSPPLSTATHGRKIFCSWPAVTMNDCVKPLGPVTMTSALVLPVLATTTVKSKAPATGLGVTVGQ